MKRMWGVKKVFSFMFITLMVSVLLTACGGGGGGSSDGGSDNQQPSNNATITGTVAGTTIKAFDLSGNEVASSTATGTPKTFSLNVPAGGSYKFYLIENEGTSSERVYALYQGTTNVFDIASAVTIDLGFVSTATGVAVPTNNPLSVSGVTSGGENTTIPPSLIKQYTASGTYTYNTGTLTLNTTSSDFVCEGPIAGDADTFTVTSLTDITMIWDGGTGYEMTWTRPSGTDGDITGTWTMSGADNSYTLTFNTDGSTFSLAGHILQCNDGGGGNSAQAYSQHWSTGYYAQFHVEDPTQQYTSVTVTGPYISGSLSLTYNQGGWERAVNDIFIGTIPPAAPLIYNFTLVSSTSTTYLTDNIEAFVELFVTNLSPSGSGVSATPTFSWTGIGSGYTYSVELRNSDGNIIWFSGINLTTTSIDYTGPALTSTATYNYNVMARDSYGNWSAVSESFVVQ